MQFLFWELEGSKGVSLPAGPKPAGLNPWSCSATSNAAPALQRWQQRAGGLLALRALCPCPCQPSKSISSFPFSPSFADLAVSLSIWRSADFKISCKWNELFPSGSVTFYILCNFQDYSVLGVRFLSLFDQRQR